MALSLSGETHGAGYAFSRAQLGHLCESVNETPGIPEEHPDSTGHFV
jgi:hypothetical protein